MLGREFGLIYASLLGLNLRCTVLTNILVGLSRPVRENTRIKFDRQSNESYEEKRTRIVSYRCYVTKSVL